MEPARFKHSTAGRCIRQPEGYWAFIPEPLPPRLNFDMKLANLLADANARVGELSGIGRVLSNPHLLIQPYIRREAVMSSRIENTQAGLDDLFFFEAVETEPPRVPDVKEVSNYVRAMEYGLERLKKLPISGRLVREIHERLMKGVRGGDATPGELRRTQNWIGPPGCTLMDATFVPPPVNEMHRAFGAWEMYLNSEPGEPVLVQCALMHYQFEAIHPFIDGNGRVGRLLITFLLCEREILSLPLLYLSAYFEKHRDEYYRRLLAVSQRGNWKGWVEFFLRGVAIQAAEVCENAKSILELHQKIQEQVQETGKAPRHTLRVVDSLFKNPIITITNISKELGVSYKSAQRCIEFLERLNVLDEITGNRRHRLYLAKDLIELIVGHPVERSQWHTH